ncbi:hypothetical protein SAMN02745126_05443 [Enhydrobacter aerosaccus]|uniref:Uncharacterized protein n=1 Tax=Enhydrobacter aerosaccus TaxID=225324 RepID=A0A1T4T0I7_9HYPH|nr:hypothetical protein [Enhydrobacter aerosaccus]SKA33973.1 hypothetical protein SAMN02745126_05443 [Enhydrobacter aerosaccus]
MATTAELAAYRAVGTLYNALMTSLVLGLVTRRGEETARDYVFRHFRRQHLEKFLPGLKKLGLADEPPAPACALYHYHSNALGGVKTGYLRESDRKAWVRYPPPRWIWRGTAIAAIPHSVSAAMLHGWHGHNGQSLGKPNLGFVCTGMTVDGLPGLEGYYYEYDRPLKQEERVRFAYGEERMPRIDWASQPKLETASWPEERRLKTFRAYAVEYLRTILPTLQDLLGPDDARKELGRVAHLVGLQFHEETARDMDLPTDLERGDLQSARLFARWLATILVAQGEEIEVIDADDAVTVKATGWRIARELLLADPLKAFDAWNELWLGAAAACDRFLKVQTTRSLGTGGWEIAWRIAPR